MLTKHQGDATHIQKYYIFVKQSIIYPKFFHPIQIKSQN